MNTLSRLSLLAILLLLLPLAACAPSTSGKVYSRDQARVSHSVYYGTILRAEPVTIEGTQTGAGTLAGGALGGVAGHSIGGGHGQGLATIGGAIAGAIAGSVIEKKATTVPGVELEVELDNGELIVVVQEADDEYKVGDRVRVIKDARGTTRVRQ
ncbi:MAG: glycine zipper 2TM domain-containing protein [Deltaproteobacteria bacterium]|nr:MAG: glycine zipper 2TM domain-containing protein [Deltaproteobacteria bacterium]